MLEVEIKKEINCLKESENSISTSLPPAANLFLSMQSKECTEIVKLESAQIQPC